MMNKLNTGIKTVKNVNRYNIGPSCLDELINLLKGLRQDALSRGYSSKVIFLIDQFFSNNKQFLNHLGCQVDDCIKFISTLCEPTTDGIDQLLAEIKAEGFERPAAVVGVGGGITLDSSKAISNLLTNGGLSADFQGWDLVKYPGIFKIGIPTISGTGAEATRTCVLINKKNGLKLGMNSDFTVFDHVILDPNLSASVPRDQFFFTGMDAYIHCVESLNGRYRNAIGDAYSRETINLCRKTFLEGDMLSASNRENLMVASFLGGCAIATSYVGVIHPLSAALSVVLGIHHCLANCIVMRAMEEFYPSAYHEFWTMATKQNVLVPSGVCKNLAESEYSALFEASIIHEKPLINALGENYSKILTKDKVIELFKKM